MKADNANREKHIRKFADARLRYQFFVFIACLIASVSFWLMIKLSGEYTLTFKIPVKFTDVPNTRILTGVTDSCIEISLKAQGYNLFLLRYLDKPKPLLISLSNGGRTNKKEEIAYEQPLLPLVRRYSASFSFVNEVRSVHPEQIKVKMNRLFSKSVPVKLSHDISFAPQYLQFDSTIIKPSHVTVFGTRAMVDSVQYAQPEVIKIRNISESLTRFVNLNSYQQKKEPFFIPSRVQVTIPVQKFTEESVEVAIKIPNQSLGHTIKLFPDKTVVSCFVSMRDYKRLDARLFTVSAFLKKSDNLYHLMITEAPDFVRNVRVTPEKVEYLVLH